MPERDRMFSVFIDYDNLLPYQKSAGILDAVTKALIQINTVKSIALTSPICCHLLLQSGVIKIHQMISVSTPVLSFRKACLITLPSGKDRLKNGQVGFWKSGVAQKKFYRMAHGELCCITPD